MGEGLYTPEEAAAEAEAMQQKIQAGEASTYAEAEQLVGTESGKEKLEDLFTPEWDAAFEAAEWYKKSVEVRARQVAEDTPLVTKLADGHVETTNVAHAGDFIITNPGGEEYAVGEEKFNSRYESKDGDPGVYKAKGAPMKAVQIHRDIKFTAPWGEEMSMRAGSWIVDGGGKDRYGIGEQEFADTYKKYTPENEQ